mmetsp:Transcript_33752/g.77065  ORF Transcript_33752/g.77065 Transcript_33752/m.77065 type:complete len:214 (+) Transcript_33752:418-1059(+)
MALTRRHVKAEVVAGIQALPVQRFRCASVKQRCKPPPKQRCQPPLQLQLRPQQVCRTAALCHLWKRSTHLNHTVQSNPKQGRIVAGMGLMRLHAKHVVVAGTLTTRLVLLCAIVLLVQQPRPRVLQQPHLRVLRQPRLRVLRQLLLAQPRLPVSLRRFRHQQRLHHPVRLLQRWSPQQRLHHPVRLLRRHQQAQMRQPATCQHTSATLSVKTQ